MADGPLGLGSRLDALTRSLACRCSVAACWLQDLDRKQPSKSDIEEAWITTTHKHATIRLYGDDVRRNMWNEADVGLVTWSL